MRPAFSGSFDYDPRRQSDLDRFDLKSEARTAFPGYLSSESSALASHHLWDGANARGASADYLKTDLLPLRSGGYGLDDLARIGSNVTPGIGGLGGLEDPALVRRDVGLTESLRKSEGLSADESNILFIDGLPNDCTRREVAHLFRPFIGFKEIKVVHKEARRSGDKAYVLCFVEFNDSKCALTAMEALQGYKFDDKKPDAPILSIQFAKFPFRPPSHDDRSRNDRRHGSAQH